MPIDVRDLGCDFLVFSSHNLLCPPGLGVLYVREEAAQELVPFIFGGGGVNRVDGGGSFFVASDRPWRFEPGPINIAGAVGLGVAAEVMRRYGMKRVLEREAALRRSIVSTLEQIDGIRVLGPRGGGDVGIVSFATTASKLFANDHVSLVLSDRFRVFIRAGCLHAIPMLHRLSTGEAACVSVAPYNDDSDIEALGRGLEIIQRALV
jgi:cysteine desulfurase/selenocysteine lyase